MDNLVSINRRGVFSLEQVRQILPIVRRITQNMSERVDEQIGELDRLSQHQKKEIAVLEKEINQLIQAWNEKIKKLGAIPKGLWLVDFEFGRGYYCWKYPETDITHWHTRDEGYTNRRPLEELAFEKKSEKPSDRSGPDQFPPRGF